MLGTIKAVANAVGSLFGFGEKVVDQFGRANDRRAGADATTSKVNAATAEAIKEGEEDAAQIRSGDDASAYFRNRNKRL